MKPEESRTLEAEISKTLGDAMVGTKQHISVTR